MLDAYRLIFLPPDRRAALSAELDASPALVRALTRAATRVAQTDLALGTGRKTLDHGLDDLPPEQRTDRVLVIAREALEAAALGTAFRLLQPQYVRPAQPVVAAAYPHAPTVLAALMVLSTYAADAPQTYEEAATPEMWAERFLGVG